ncbi:MAG TPA: hypothetical protein VEI97_13140 [bacterium]|nr:hypothetical protein [bacterium]
MAVYRRPSPSIDPALILAVAAASLSVVAALLALDRRRTLDRPRPVSSRDPEGALRPWRPLAEIAAECFKDVPDEEWERYPLDLSANLDHYLYGVPKKEP